MTGAVTAGILMVAAGTILIISTSLAALGIAITTGGLFVELLTGFTARIVMASGMFYGASLVVAGSGLGLFGYGGVLR